MRLLQKLAMYQRRHHIPAQDQEGLQLEFYAHGNGVVKMRWIRDKGFFLPRFSSSSAHTAFCCCLASIKGVRPLLVMALVLAPNSNKLVRQSCTLSLVSPPLGLWN